MFQPSARRRRIRAPDKSHQVAAQVFRTQGFDIPTRRARSEIEARGIFLKNPSCLVLNYVM